MKALRNLLILLMLALLSAFSETKAQMLDSMRLFYEEEYYDLKYALSNADKVYKLSLRRKKLTKVPDDVSTFFRLQHLDLSRNKIAELPAFLFSFRYLQKLDLTNTRITELSADIGKLSNLTHLTLNGTKIKSLPPEIGELRNLVILELAGTAVYQLPKEIKNCTKLKIVDMRSVDLSEYNVEVIKDLLPKGVEFMYTPDCNCKR